MKTGGDALKTSGIIQSCRLSMHLLNLLMNTWARSVKAGTTTAMPKVCADDAGVLSKDCENIDVALKSRDVLPESHSKH